MLHDEAGDRALARLFGEETAHEVDKLDTCSWEAGPDGVPVFPTCDWFAGLIVDRVDLGDHVGFVLEVSAGRAARIGERHLAFTDVRGLDAGNPA